VPRPESVANESNEQTNQGKHRDRECANSLSYCQAVRTAFSGGTAGVRGLRTIERP
jgi:hypothetical protein